MTKWYILLTFVQLHVLLGNGKAEEINLIQSIKAKVSTSMSSTSNYQASGVTSWYSNNSIDNKATGDPNTCGCCAGTSGLEPPWLQIDLGSVYTIKKVQITGRPNNSNREQFQNIYVYVSNTSMISSNGSLVYHGNSSTNIMFTLLQQPPISFRYLMIRRFTTSYLTICEVELFGAGLNLLDHIRDEVLTYQSSIFLGNKTSFGPDNAIDGEENYSIDSCQCCSVTNKTSLSSWWYIDLRYKYSVDTLEIYGRDDLKSTEQLQGAKVFASNVSMNTDVNQGQLLYTVPSITNTTHFIKQLDEAVTAKFFIISLKSPILTLCEFIVYGTDFNILRSTISATTNQSKTFQTCSADRAIDGTDSPVPLNNDNDLCATCSVAQRKDHSEISWWQLDLGSKFLVNLLRIFGRPNQEDQSQNITVYINNISMEDNQIGTMLPINSSMGHIFLTELKEPRLFQYLKIQKQDTVLTLCEVKLYEAECHIGTFGDRCSNQCQCADKLNCDTVKGTCVSEGCLPGWKGPSCNKFCDYRRFGINCSTVCNCRDNTSCDAITGHCKTGLCNKGWLGLSCDKGSHKLFIQEIIKPYDYVKH